MENKKVNEKNENVEVKENEIKVIEVKEEGLKLFVEREKFQASNGQEYWGYFSRGDVRGRAVKVDFIPKDKGGYEPLDIVFSIAPKAELIMTEETMVDSFGSKTKYKTYKVVTRDESGELECGVKPARDSDKALLKMLIDQLKANAEKANNTTKGA